MNAEEYLNSQRNYLICTPNGMAKAHKHKQKVFVWVEMAGMLFPARSRLHASKLIYAAVEYSMQIAPKHRKLSGFVDVGPQTATLKRNGSIEYDIDRQPEATYWSMVLRSAMNSPRREYG